MIHRIMWMIGLSGIDPAVSAKLAEQANLRAMWNYSGSANNHNLQERRRVDDDRAEQSREAPKKRQTLLDGLMVSMLPKKRDTGEQSKRSPWARYRRRGDPSNRR
jgi:hypothetical protein